MDEGFHKQAFSFRLAAAIAAMIVVAVKVFASLFDIVQGRTWLHAWVVDDAGTVLGWIFLTSGILSLIHFFPIRGFRSIGHIFAPVGLLSYWGYATLSGDELRILPVEYGIVVLLVLSSTIRIVFAFLRKNISGNPMGLAIVSLLLGCLSFVGAATGLTAVVIAGVLLLPRNATCGPKCRDIAFAGLVTGTVGDTLKWVGMHLIDALWMSLLR